ncbi:MAG: DUF3047 domain-containing protein [Betaproteobacteria bacterium]
MIKRTPALLTCTQAVRPMAAFVAVLSLAACSVLPQAPSVGTQANPWELAGRAEQGKPLDRSPSLWHHQTFPGKRKNQYSYVWREGRPAMAVRSDGAISALRKVVDAQAGPVSGIRFSWKVASLLEKADLQDAARSDSPVRIVLAFEGDRSLLSARDQMLSELARALTGEEMPYATLMYVWSNQLPVGTVVNSRRTDRIRKMVIESGPVGLNRWLDYERDVRADYERAFGEAPGRLVAVGIMSDSDNTGGSVRAWYGPVVLQRSP